jgi:hypothetical protein
MKRALHRKLKEEVIMAEKIESKLTGQLCEALLSLKKKSEMQNFLRISARLASINLWQKDLKLPGCFIMVISMKISLKKPVPVPLLFPG